MAGGPDIDGEVRSDENKAAEDQSERRIGTTVDKFTIVRQLGKGGMGAVYEARHARLSRRFAIKFLLPEFATNREVLRRFENEAKAAGGLEHPNLAAVTDVGQAADGAPYLVMEFLEGEDCAKLLRRTGPLPVQRAADIVLQACRGLAVAHKVGIVHRDLKPENIFIAAAGDGRDQVKVLDFGIAKLRVTEASVVTGTGATFGTAFYMSPEQARGAGEVDHRSDVWSMGVVLYELLSGQKPFTGEQFLQIIYQILSVEPPPLAQVRSGLPADLLALIERALRKNPAERVPSVVALAEALAPFAAPANAGVPQTHSVPLVSETVASPQTMPPVAAVASRSGRGRAILIAGIAVAVAAIAVAVGIGTRKSPVAVASPPAVHPIAAPAATPVSLPLPTPVAVPAAVAPVPAAPAFGSQPIVAKTVSAPSGQSEHRSDKHRPSVAKRNPGAVPPSSDSKLAPPQAPAPTGHRIEIEKNDPYGR